MNWEEELGAMTNMSQDEIKKRIAELVKLEKPVDPEEYKKFKESLQGLDNMESDY